LVLIVTFVVWFANSALRGKIKMVTITKEVIQAGRSEKGGWKREQLRLLGLDVDEWWPKGKSLITGWQDCIIGHEVSDMAAVEFAGIGATPWKLKLQPDTVAPPKHQSRVAQLFADGKSFAEVEATIKYPD
jgi:hypothetical protein